MLSCKHMNLNWAFFCKFYQQNWRMLRFVIAWSIRLDLIPRVCAWVACPGGGGLFQNSWQGWAARALTPYTISYGIFEKSYVPYYTATSKRGTLLYGIPWLNLPDFGRIEWNKLMKNVFNLYTSCITCFRQYGKTSIYHALKIDLFTI